jgi:arginase
MAEAALLELPYPEAGVVEADSLDEQIRRVAADLPERPLVLGGCCCSHVGAVRALAVRHAHLAVVWVDAHGDLNTPESSPSGNSWGMPLRMVIDGGFVRPGDVALVGARNLDPPEEEFIAAAGVQTGPDAVERALEGADAVYVAIDADAFDPAELTSFMPEPGGLSIEDGEAILAETALRTPIAGAGLSGLRPDPANLRPISQLLAALNL